MVNRKEPNHKPGLRTKVMCEIATRYRMGYYSAVDGDSWSPDLPRPIESEIEQRFAKFVKGCANRSLND